MLLVIKYVFVYNMINGYKCSYYIFKTILKYINIKKKYKKMVNLVVLIGNKVVIIYLK
jgi:hypothetical protein